MQTIPKLKLLAERLDLSESTVSRALNNYSDIAEQTKELVRNLADEMGYQPNIHARRLASGKADTVAFVMPPLNDQLNNSFFSELMTGMALALDKRGWDLQILAPNNAAEQSKFFKRISRSGNISGLVISRTLIQDPRFEILKKLEIPFISFGRSENIEESAWVDVDNKKAFVEVTGHLFNLGHHAIASIGGPPIYNFTKQRAEGWSQAMAELDVSVPQQYLETSELSFEGGKAAMKRLLSLGAPPTAVCCVSDVVAIGAMQALRENGLQPGSDVSLIGYDGLNIGDWLEPPLSTMRQPIEEAGRQLSEMLIKIIEGGQKTSAFQKLFRATLVRRGTDNPPKLDGSHPKNSSQLKTKN